MKGNAVGNKVSIAPMVDRTDRNFRNFVRMINIDNYGSIGFDCFLFHLRCPRLVDDRQV